MTHVQKNLIYFNPKLYSYCREIFRVVSQIIYATDNTKVYRHEEATLYHLLCFVSYILYMSVYEISKDGIENDRKFKTGENEEKLLHSACGTFKKTLLKQVNAMVGGKGTSNLLLFWLHNALYLLKYKLPLASWSDRHDEKSLQQWLVVCAEVRSTGLKFVGNHIVFSFRNFVFQNKPLFLDFFVHKKRKKLYNIRK